MVPNGTVYILLVALLAKKLLSICCVQCHACLRLSARANIGLPTDLVKQIELLCSAFPVRSTRLLSMVAILLKT
jgi:hypothetical protein